MSSYNIVEKVKYSQNPHDAVALREYIVFEDEESESKYIMCKFVNNVNQRLYGMKFEVMQYDENGDIVARSVALYHDFSANANETFVPNAKLNVSYRCKTISFRLLYASFDRIKFEDGKLVDNAYAFDRYVSDVGLITSPDNKMSAVTTYPEVKVIKKEKGEKPFYVKNITKKNVAKFPVFFNFLIVLAVFAFAITSLIMFRRTSKQFTLDDFDVKIVSRQEKTVGIEAYNGDKTDLVIPSELGGYTIVKIESGAFKKSAITSLKIESESMIISEKAFTDCTSLKSITAEEGRISVLANAFNGCSSLSEVKMPNATIAAESFVGSLAVKEMDIAGCTATSMGQVFGEGAENMSLNLSLNISVLTVDFLKDIGIGKLTIKNPDCEIEFGALEYLHQDGYEKFDNVELIGGVVVSVSAVDGKFVLPSAVKQFDAAKFADKTAEVTHLTVSTTNLDFSTAFFGAFPQLQTLEITDRNIIRDGETLRYCTARNLITPLLGNKLADYLQGATFIDSVEISSAANSVPNEYFDGLELRKIVIGNSVPGISRGTFSGIKSLELLSIPNFTNGSLFDYYATGFADIVIDKLVLTPASNRSTLRSQTFFWLTNVKEIEVADGFAACESRIINGTASSLEKITLPEGISCSYPVIESGCNRLTEVTAYLESDRPYAEFNRSYESTRALNVTVTKAISGGFFIGCENINALRISAPSLASRTLNNMYSLEYLELDLDYSGSSLTQIFGESSGARYVYLRQLVIDNTDVPNFYFADATNSGILINELYFLNLKSLNSDILSGIGTLNAIYIPKSVAADSGAVSALNNINAYKLLFGGKKSDFGGLNESNFMEIEEEVENIGLYLTHFYG